MSTRRATQKTSGISSVPPPTTLEVIPLRPPQGSTRAFAIFAALVERPSSRWFRACAPVAMFWVLEARVCVLCAPFQAEHRGAVAAFPECVSVQGRVDPPVESRDDGQTGCVPSFGQASADAFESMSYVSPIPRTAGAAYASWLRTAFHPLSSNNDGRSSGAA